MFRFSFFLIVWLLCGFSFAYFDRREVGEFADLVSRQEANFLKHYNWSAQDKRRRVLIVGGSNALVGIHSRTISEAFSLPVLNLSLPQENGDHKFMYALALNRSRPGDIVVYSTLRFWFWNEKVSNEHRASVTARRMGLFEYSQNLDFSQKLEYFWKPLPTEINPLGGLASLVTGQRSRESNKYFMGLNAFGDVKTCDPKFDLEPFDFSSHGDIEKFKLEIEGFRNQLLKKGVTLVNVAPWILVKPEQKSLWVDYYRKTIWQLRTSFRPQDFSELVIRTDPKDFCDSNSHLTREVAKDRSKMHLVARLTEVLEPIESQPL